jgi:hypothetical protein
MGGDLLVLVSRLLCLPLGGTEVVLGLVALLPFPTPR